MEYAALISIYCSLDKTPKSAILKHYFKWPMYSRSRESKKRCSQKSVMFKNEISMGPYFYEPYLLAVKISESFILPSKFKVIHFSTLSAASARFEK